jgi:hypothetical protein
MLTGRTIRLAVVLAVAFSLLAVFGSTTAGATEGSPPLLPGPRDALTRTLERGEISPAVYALWRARSLFQLGAVRDRFGDVARSDPRAATLVLRDLVARYRMLGPADRAVARRILARPDDPQGDTLGIRYGVPARDDCQPDFCVHWVDTTVDAPNPADTNGNGIPDYVDTTELVMQTVWDKEVVDLGYRPPKSDLAAPNHGPDGKLDIYLADLGRDGIYGYCVPDDTGEFQPPYQGLSVYCVVDNDFSPNQYAGFGGATGVNALEVTLAHEFFHAVQASYDLFDDLVLVEGTAVWMEDEVYNDVNDNYYYLRFSALKRPDVPFDIGITNVSSPYWGFYYGAFVFYRYLSERFATPDIVRRIWEFADATPPATNQYSLQAIDSALRERGTSFQEVFADWTAANAFPAASYEEGANYPRPPFTARRRLPALAAQKSGHVILDHLTSSYVELVPGSHLGRRARLRITLKLPALARGSAATILSVSPRGAIAQLRPQLHSDGRGTTTVPFSPGRVSKIVLVLTNAGTDYICNRGAAFACEGIPRDDHLMFRYTATVV